MNRTANLLATVGLAMLTLCANAKAESNGDIISEGYRIDRYQSPTNIGELANTPEGRAIISAVATYFGVSPAVIATMNALPVSVQSTNEEGRVDIPVPSGYRTCQVTYNFISQIPHSGDQRARTKIWGYTDLDDNAVDQVSIDYWLKKGMLGEGQTSFEADVTVMAVRKSIWSRYADHCVQHDTEYYNNY